MTQSLLERNLQRETKILWKRGEEAAGQWNGSVRILPHLRCKKQAHWGTRERIWFTIWRKSWGRIIESREAISAPPNCFLPRVPHLGVRLLDLHCICAYFPFPVNTPSCQIRTVPAKREDLNCPVAAWALQPCKGRTLVCLSAQVVIGLLRKTFPVSTL